MGVREARFNCICESANLSFVAHLLKRKKEGANTKRKSKRLKNVLRKSAVIKGYLSIRLRTAQKGQLKERPVYLFFYKMAYHY